MAQHWTCLMDFVFGGGTFAHFAKLSGYFASLTKKIFFLKYFLQTTKYQNYKDMWLTWAMPQGFVVNRNENNDMLLFNTH